MAKRTVEMPHLKDDARIDFDNPLERSIAYQNLQKTIGCTTQEFRELLSHLEQEKRPRVGGLLTDVCNNAKTIRPIIDRLLPENCITIVASESGVGKSALMYRIAVAGAYGGKLFGELQAREGNVLIVQTDESDSNMKSKISQMGVSDPEGRIQVEFAFSSRNYNLREDKRAPGEVCAMDSLGCPLRAAISTSETGPHLQTEWHRGWKATPCSDAPRASPARKREPHNGKTGEGPHGNQYITAAASDGESQPSPTRNAPSLLKVIKPRSSVTGAGVVRLTGDLEDLSFGSRRERSEGCRREAAKKVLSA